MLLLGVPAVLAWQQSENDTMALAEPPSGEQQQLQETKNSVHRGWFGIPDTNPQSRLIRALIIVIITSTVCQVVLLIWILINRNRIHAVEAKTGRLLEQFQTLLVDYLFSENNNEQFREIQRIAAFDFDRRILINQMIDLSINLSGESKEKLRDLYFKLELDQDSLFKAHSSMWHIQIKGFKEMAFMNIKEASQQIRNALKSKNNILRMEAQLALVRLNEDDPFGFLDDLKRPFTLWEQLNVHELIIFHNLPIPDFSRWTNSTNKTVVIFSLRMIQVFKQTGAMQAIINCLSHPDREVRHTAIRVCGEIQLHDTLPHLKHIYKSEDRDNCLAIIHAMEKMRNESMLGFLKLVLDKEEDVQLQIGAAVAISKMGETGISALVKLMKSEYKDYQIIIRHVLDKRIN
jgi:hypothetical protein